MTEKQAILRDLKVIAILDKKIDYSDHENIGAVLKLNPKSLFSTEYGKRYLERIQQMYDGEEYEHTCILCGSPTEGENPVCKNCYAMITLGNASVPEKPKPVVTERVSEEKKAETETGTTEVPEQLEEESPDENPDENHLTDDELAEVPPEELIEKAKEDEAEETPEEEEEAEVQEETEEELEKGSYDADLTTAKGKHLDLARALILLFIVACFSIAVVCGLILIIRDLRLKHQNSEIQEKVVKDADLRDYYSIMQTNAGYKVSVEDES
ncbi:MAG: hypothetical protein PUF16_07140 [Lachnospiraceae bacterium]|nr:hypothetical protein [Lachnospiraceae bacterium]